VTILTAAALYGQRLDLNRISEWDPIPKYGTLFWTLEICPPEVSSNNSSQASNTPQRNGHASAVIRYSNAFVLSAADASLSSKRISDTIIFPTLEGASPLPIGGAPL